MPQINEAGLMLIKSFEGCSLTAYADPGSGGVPYTIGYGHTGSCESIGLGQVELGMTITQDQAESLLRNDLDSFEVSVNNLVERDLTPNQFAALVSFTYNVGVGAFSSSTLLRDVNVGNFDGAKYQFGEWVNGFNGPLPGLVRRRAAEAALFSS